MLNIFRKTITDDGGNVQSGVDIVVRNADTDALVLLFADKEGTTPIPYPVQTGAGGLVEFYCEAQKINVTATKGEFVAVYKDDWVKNSMTSENKTKFPTKSEGVAAWDSGITYNQNAITMGSDGNLYQAQQVTQGNDPASDRLNWRIYISQWDQDGYKASGLVEDAPNIIAGHSKNHIVSDTHSCVIAGGGLENRENVIGGNAANVNTGNSNINSSPVLGTQSQFCMIGGGYDNVVNGLANVIPVGQHCLVDILADHGTVTGGSVNWILEGSYNGIYGGSRNTIGLGSGGYSLIAGGGDNIIDGVGSHVFIGSGSLCKAHDAEFSVITGGIQNILDGCSGSTITGGNGNRIELGNSTIAGGNGNTIAGTGQGCFIGGGINNSVSGENSFGTGRDNETTFDFSEVTGYRAKATRDGERTRSDGYFSEVGDAKSSAILLKKTVTSASETILEDVTAGSSFPIKTNRLIGFTVKIIGHRTDVVGDNCMIILQGMAHRGSSGAHTIVSLADQIVSSAGASTWTARVLDSTASLRVGVRGEAAKTINWLAEVEWLETFGG